MTSVACARASSASVYSTDDRRAEDEIAHRDADLQLADRRRAAANGDRLYPSLNTSMEIDAPMKKNASMILACSLIVCLASGVAMANDREGQGVATLADERSTGDEVMLHEDNRQSERLPLRFCSSRVPGSYLLSLRFSDGSFSSRGVLSLVNDGVLVVNDSSQGGLAGIWDPFTSGQGAWRCAARDRFYAVSINFNIPGDIDPDGGLARLDYRGRVDRRGRIDGTVELRLFELHQDPWSDVVAPTDVFRFDGRRIEATAPR